MIQYLLQVDSGFTWWGLVTLLLGLIFTLVGIHLKGQNSDLKQDIGELWKENERLKSAFDRDIREVENGIKETDRKLNEVNIKILDDMRAISIKVAEFRRDLNN